MSAKANTLQLSLPPRAPGSGTPNGTKRPSVVPPLGLGMGKQATPRVPLSNRSMTSVGSGSSMASSRVADVLKQGGGGGGGSKFGQNLTAENKHLLEMVLRDANVPMSNRSQLSGGSRGGGVGKQNSMRYASPKPPMPSNENRAPSPARSQKSNRSGLSDMISLPHDSQRSVGLTSRLSEPAISITSRLSEEGSVDVDASDGTLEKFKELERRLEKEKLRFLEQSLEKERAARRKAEDELENLEMYSSRSGTPSSMGGSIKPSESVTARLRSAEKELERLRWAMRGILAEVGAKDDPVLASEVADVMAEGGMATPSSNNGHSKSIRTRCYKDHKGMVFFPFDSDEAGDRQSSVGSQRR